MNDNARLRVVLVATSLGFGGAEHRILDMVRDLAPRGYHITVVAAASTGVEHPLAPKIEAAGGVFVQHPLRTMSGWLGLRGLLASADVVHTHIGPAGGLIALVARLSGTGRRIIHFHSERPELPSGLAGKVALRLGAQLVRRNATTVVGVSPDALHAVLGRHWALDERAVVIAPGVDLAPFRRQTDAGGLRRVLGLPEASRVMVQVGRDDPLKNRPFAVRILAESADPDLHLAFIGGVETRSRDAVHRLSVELGVDDRVHWTGLRDDVAALLQEADVMVLPSEYEGIPGVVLEAVAAGCPVIATDLPGTRQIRGVVGDQLNLLDLVAGPSAWASAVDGRATTPLTDAEPWRLLQGTQYDAAATTSRIEQLWVGNRTSPRPRVVHLFSSLDFGGAEMRTLELLQHLRERSYEVTMLQTSGTPGPLTGDFEAAGARVVNVRFRSWEFVRVCKCLFSDGATRAAHVHVMRQHERPVLMLALAARWGVPTRVLHYRNEGSEPRGLSGRIVEWFYHQIGLRVATVIGGVSPSSVEAALGSRAQSDPRARLLLPGLGVERFAVPGAADHLHRVIDVPATDPLVLVLGRDAHQKFRERAVRVFAEMQLIWPEARLVFVGATDRTAEELVATSGATQAPLDRIHILQARRDVVEILQSAAVLLLPSRHEGLPGVVIESLAAGTPVVATSLPGTRFLFETFPQDVTLIESDAPESAWADALKEHGSMARGSAPRAALHSRVRESKFAMSQVAREYECAWGVDDLRLDT